MIAITIDHENFQFINELARSRQTNRSESLNAIISQHRNALANAAPKAGRMLATDKPAKRSKGAQ